MALVRRPPSPTGPLPAPYGGDAGPGQVDSNTMPDADMPLSKEQQLRMNPLGPSPIPEPEAGVPPPNLARGGETPREREMGGGGPQLRSVSAPPQSQTPSPIAGGGGVIPFPPMANAGGSMARPRGGLFGMLGGLKGGGLGVPFDPTSNQESDPISTLLKLLGKG